MDCHDSQVTESWRGFALRGRTCWHLFSGPWRVSGGRVVRVLLILENSRSPGLATGWRWKASRWVQGRMEVSRLQAFNLRRIRTTGSDLQHIASCAANDNNLQIIVKIDITHIMYIVCVMSITVVKFIRNVARSVQIWAQCFNIGFLKTRLMIRDRDQQIRMLFLTQQFRMLFSDSTR